MGDSATTGGRTRRNSILLVTGDEAVQRSVFAGSGFAYWSAAFDNILEKNGYLAFDTATHAALCDPGRLAGYDALIVGWLPAGLWSDAMAAGLRAFAGPTVIEGPVPACLYAHCGIADASDSGAAAADLEFADPALAEFLSTNYRDILPLGRLYLGGKTIQTRPVRFNRWDYDFDPADMSFDDWAHRIVRSIRVPSLNRFARRTPFLALKDNLFICVFLLLFYGRGGRLADSALADVKAIAECARGAPGADRERRLLAVIDALAPPGWNDLPAEPVDAPPMAARPYSAIDDLAISLAEHDAGIARIADRALADMLSRHVRVVDGSASLRRRVVLRELCVLAWGFLRSGDRATAETLLRRIIDHALTPEDGTLVNMRFADDGAKKVGEAGFHAYVGLAFMAMRDDVAEAAFIGETFPARYGQACIDAWAAAPLTIQSVDGLTGDAAAPIALALDGRQAPGAIRNGRVLSFPFQILSVVAHFHTMHPLDGPFTDCDASPAIILEPAFFALFESLCRDCGAPLFRIEPWPAGHRYCLTIRHDVDRIPAPELFDDLLRFETENDLAVSWYWIFNRLRGDQLRRQAEAGHEIALHGMKHDGKSSELAALSAATPAGREIVGEFLHGGGGGEYWLGHPTVAAAAEAGLLYAEGMSTLYDFPCRWPWVREDGVIDRIDIVCLSHGVSVDRPVEDRGQMLWNEGRVAAMVRTGAYVMVLNHPDHHLDRLKRIVTRDLPDEGRLDWTCAQVAAWWRATHRRESLGLRWTGSDLRMTPEYSAAQIVLAVGGDADPVALPAGARRLDDSKSGAGGRWKRFAIDLTAGESLRLGLTAGGPRGRTRAAAQSQARPE